MYLFVYGTLKKGHGNHRVLDGAKCVAEKAMLLKHDMYSMGGFPGIVPGEGTVYGEVYEIEDRHLPRLDSLEGYNESWREEDCMYLRREARVHFTDDANWYQDVFVYIWNSDVRGRRKIEDGVW